METAAASSECDPLEIEAFEVAPVEAAAAGNEKSHGRSTPKLSSFSVFDKLSLSDVKGSAASRPPIRWEPASEGESAGGLPTSIDEMVSVAPVIT